MNRDLLLSILELAKWAPSGDNTQPWRFEVLSDEHLVVHGHDTREWCVYDYNGWASQLAHGMLLETLRIAASGKGVAAEWKLRADGEERHPVFDVYFTNNKDMETNSLFHYIEKRVVQRRPMRMKPLTEFQRQKISAAVGAGYELQFFESFGERLNLAKLLWENAHIRLTCPEAFEVHRQVIEWGARYSKDRIPEHALGCDPITGLLMRWVMGSWSRVDFFNRYLLGTVIPRIQLDFVPALMCSAHILVKTKIQLDSLIDRVNAGAAIQRLWLTVTSLGLHLQPEMTPVIFRWYSRSGSQVSSLALVNQEVSQVAEKIDSLLPDTQCELVFLCRLGESASPTSRSTRKQLYDLMVNGS